LRFISAHGKNSPINRRIPPMRTIVFDLDGTLADTSGDLIAAANVCFADIGIAGLSQAMDQATALRGGRAMLRLGLSRQGDVDEAMVDKYYPVLLEAYRANLSEQTVFFEGALDAIQALRDRGDRVTICTNKPAGLAEQLMRDLQARDLFHALVGADTLPVRKPDPAPYIAAVERAGGNVKCSCMIGDTLTDHSTARAVGVSSILVDFGPGDEDVKALNPDAILSRFADLPDLVARLLP
jgi:phosphoglycolate phosphatase